MKKSSSYFYLFLDAIQDGDVEGCRALVKRGVDIELADDEGRGPLHWAALHNRPEICSYLISLGSPVDRQDKLGRTALYLAAGKGSEQACQALIALGADVDVRTKDGQTPIHHVARTGQVSTCRLLIEAGADVDQGENINQSMVQNAIKYGNIPVAMMLAKASVYQKRSQKELSDALYGAIIENDLKLLKEFHASGMDFNTVLNISSNTPLTQALYQPRASNRLEVIEFFLKAGADPNFQDERGITPLVSAIYINAIQEMELLIQYGASMDIVDKDEKSPLFHAVRRSIHLDYRDSVEPLECLIRHGVDLTTTHKGKTVMEVAQGHCRTFLERHLMDHIVPVDSQDKDEGNLPFLSL